MSTFFSEYFGIDAEKIDDFGAFNVSLVNDLPLFIDPFLLFHSENETYQELHNDIISYVVFLKDRALRGDISRDLLSAWYCFPEIKQTWLGFSVSGNSGSGLGIDFARNLHRSSRGIFSNFGDENISHGSHIEKLCLIGDGIGRDNISDFTANLIVDHLCRFTENFCQKFLRDDQVRRVSINRARFNYNTEAWERRRYTLPWINNDYVILTPRDILTRDENWINRSDLVSEFESLPIAITDTELRSQISNYFERTLSRRRDHHPTKKERAAAALQTISRFPELLDYFIRSKEDRGDDAAEISAEKVDATERQFISEIRSLQQILLTLTDFYYTGWTSYDEAMARLLFLKDVIENKGGWRIFYDKNKPIEREKDLQIMFRLVWFGTPFDIGAEVNDGRGPVDFKISRGAFDKTLVEMKLAKNKQLERNLMNQLPIYQAASDAPRGIKSIIFFTAEEEERTIEILARLQIVDHPDIVLIDARADNKPSGSKA